MLQFLPYAMAAFGGYKGYRQAKDSGASGLGRILGGATGAVAGYYGGKGVLGGGSALGIPGFSAAQSSFTPFTQAVQGLPFVGSSISGTPNPRNLGVDKFNNMVPNPNYKAPTQGGSLERLKNLITRKRVVDGVVTGEREINPMAAGIGIGALSYLSGAFKPKDIDIFTPTYNLGYADLAANRPDFKYIDPATGQEKVYEKIYIPEADPKNRGDAQLGPYAVERTTFKAKTGGLAEIKKFNEGGINYLPSKMTHDENDSNNYKRASGYVEDGAGVGDKDEDTMLAQLADGEFVTRADGVLGAGIINGGNPNSMKDMREKGAAFFYEQQKRYKRVFDLLKESNGIDTKKN
jgi:hypothetical protein